MGKPTAISKLFLAFCVLAAAAMALIAAVPMASHAEAHLHFPAQDVPVLSGASTLDIRDMLASREPPVVFPLPAPSLEADIRRYYGIVDSASRTYGVDRALVQAMIMVESTYDREAVSPVGASGLMQLMPETARQYRVNDLFDPKDNVYGGVRYMKDLLKQFDGDVELAVAAYNAGAGAVIRAGNRIPDNPETTAFVPKVIGYQQRFMARNTRS